MDCTTNELRKPFLACLLITTPNAHAATVTEEAHSRVNLGAAHGHSGRWACIVPYHLLACILIPTTHNACAARVVEQAQTRVIFSSPSHSERPPKTYPKQENHFTSRREEAGSYEQHERYMQSQLYL